MALQIRPHHIFSTAVDYEDGIMTPTPTMHPLHTIVAKLNPTGIPKFAASLYRKEHSPPVNGTITSVINDKAGNLSIYNFRLG